MIITDWKDKPDENGWWLAAYKYNPKHPYIELVYVMGDFYSKDPTEVENWTYLSHRLPSPIKWLKWENPFKEESNE